AERLTLMNPGAVPPATVPDRAHAFFHELGLPPGTRPIVAVGHHDANSNLKSAICVFDMLRYEFPDLYLLVFGAGRERASLEAFGRAIAADDYRVRFAPDPLDPVPLLGLADAVWALDERDGALVALEALAAGCPV